MGLELGGAGGVGGQVALVGQAFGEDHVEQPVDQHDVGAGPHREMEVGHHRRLRDPGVDDDQPGPARAEEPGGEQRVAVGDVGAEQHDGLRRLEVVVAAGRAVAAEGQLVARHGRGHAQRGVAVVVADAEAEPRQLAEGVELLGHQLPGGEDGDAVGAVPLHQPGEPGDEPVDRLVPGGPPPVDPRAAEPPVRSDRVVLGQPLGAEPAPVHRVVGIALHGHGVPVPHPEKHPATHRAVAAGGADPPLRHPAGAHRPEALVVAVRVAVPAVFGAEPRRQATRRRPQRLHARLRWKEPGMSRGTTVT